MRIKIILLLVVPLAVSVWSSARSEDKPKTATAPAETIAEAKANADYARAEKAAREADAALAPLRTAMQQADSAYANASKTANARQQQAADAKNLAGPQGVQDVKQAEANLAAAVKALADATRVKPLLDKTLADAKAAAQPLQQAFDAAEKAAKEAEALAKSAQDTANKLDDEAKKATVQAAALRRTADTAKASLTRAQQNERQALAQASVALQKLAEAEARNKAANEALANVRKQAAAAAQAGAKTNTGDAAKAALAPAQPALQAAQATANAAAQKLARATAQKKLAEAAVGAVRSRIAAAMAAAQAAETAAQAAARLADEKNQATARAGALRKAAADAADALARAQQLQQQAQAQATAIARKVDESQTRKQAADLALVNASNQVAASTTALQAAQKAAAEILRLDSASKQAAANAAARRKSADAARSTLAPVAQKLEQAAIQANQATQELTRAEERKKAAEAGLADLKKRIAAAIQTHVADDQAARKAVEAAAPLRLQAEKTRAAYTAATEIADNRRALAEQAKAALYRLVAARQVASLMESPDPPRPANRIDELVLARLTVLGIKPALCSDAVFVRRAYLDVTGKLPAAEEARAFIRDSNANKRVTLIDRLLERPEHVAYWAMKWGDVLRVKAEFPVKIWPNAAQAYYRWVWESIAQNKPYDRFARELLTSSGSNFRLGPINFYRAIQNRTPEGIVAAVGLTFMGTRVHLWPENRRAGMAVFFSQVGYKPTSEWKEEIVYWDPLRSAALPGSTAPGIDDVARSVTATNQVPQALGQPIAENQPIAAVFPDGTKTTIPSDRDPREVFADWLIRPENPWFARAIVNRTWAWVMGRGIISEPDDIRPDNPPSNPELMDYLEREFISSGYNMKHLKRLIFTSATYQFSSIQRTRSPAARASFASYLLRRVEAEVLIDALNDITGSSDLYTSAVPEPFTYIPSDMSAVALADGSITSSFLTMFGRSARATGMEAERVNELASTQWLHMLNSATIQSKLQSGPKLAALLQSGGSTKDVAEKLYLTILSRFPTDADVKAVEEYAKTGVTQGRDVWLDIAWALINSPEFLLRH